jgi:hypothetical protein
MVRRHIPGIVPWVHIHQHRSPYSVHCNHPKSGPNDSDVRPKHSPLSTLPWNFPTSASPPVAGEVGMNLCVCFETESQLDLDLANVYEVHLNRLVQVRTSVLELVNGGEGL